MMVEIIAELGDITTYETDAIVNAANSELLGGGGVDGAIHRAGGPAILEECRTIVRDHGGCPTGEAVITTGGQLPARHVIHTVGPIWANHVSDEADRLLASAYTSSLALADEHRSVSVAFPNISTGVYGFPRSRASDIAVSAVSEWFQAHPAGTLQRIVFVCFDEENLDLYRCRLS
jgi:O-acetyl-ADP-ribose deacetylase (regulator of RNase III)